MKKHYRNVFKSDHLSSYDLEDFIEQGRPLEFTIKFVEQFVLENSKGGVKVAGKVISANIAHFVEDIKPMVINAGNSNIMAKFSKSSFVNDWNNINVELYVKKNIKFGKETRQGIGIKDTPPVPLTEKDINLIKGKVSIITSQDSLNKFYADLSTKEKTNKDVIDILKEKQTDLKQV
jgi:hypothetical protein